MAQADRLVGQDLVVVFLPTGGVAPADNLTLTGDQTNFTFNKSLDTVDVTAGSDLARYFKPTVEGMDWTLMVFDANQSWLDNLQPRAQGLLTIYKQGVGSTKPYHSFNALITGYSEDLPFDGALEVEITGVRQGAMVADIGSVQA